MQRRLTAFDIHPSGPLWGRGAPETQGHSLQLEREIASEFQDVANLLEGEGLTQERRSLRSVVRELAVEADAGTITLSFMLARGQFATSVLREICELESTPALESDDE
jgi:tRNA pseudouridine13 synthase